MSEELDSEVMLKADPSAVRGVAGFDALSGVYIGEKDTEVEHATFGEKIDQAARTKMDTREPVARRITEGIAKDIFSSWFKLALIGTEGKETDSKKFDMLVQEQLNILNLKEKLIKGCHFERRDGTAFIALGMGDTGSETEVQPGATITDIEAYPLEMYDEKKEDMIQEEKSLRFGYPEYIRLKRGGQAEPLRLHFSRVIILATRMGDHKFLGESLLERVWDDLLMYRTIRYGVAQGMIRWGTGVPCIKFPRGTKGSKMDEVMENQIGDPHNRTVWTLAEPIDLEFKGLQGIALNPEPYERIILKNIAMGADIPVPILEGANVGYVTASETNERKYFKMITNQQLLYEPAIRKIIGHVLGLVEGYDLETKYDVVWNTPFKLTETQKAREVNKLAQSCTYYKDFMKLDEIRVLMAKVLGIELPPITGTNGETIIGLEQIKNLQMNPFGNPVQPGMKKEKIENA